MKNGIKILVTSIKNDLLQLKIFYNFSVSIILCSYMKILILLKYLKI